MTTKNGFEIRLEVLKMAKEMLDQQYNDASNAYWSVLHSTAERWNKSVEELVKQTQETKPVMYSPQDIMEKAQELYGFVSKKD
jgi:peptide methionine sulfoxide reductase MsrA